MEVTPKRRFPSCAHGWFTTRRPTPEEAATRLDALAAFAACHPRVPQGDLPHLRAELAEQTGDWIGALRWWEQSWADYDESYSGYTQSGKAVGAFLVSLKLGREEDAARWLDLLARTERERAYSRASLHQCQTHLPWRV